MLLAFAVLAWLPDGPADAHWLNAGERAAIAARLAREPAPDHHALWPALRDLRVWLLALPYFGIVLALYGLNFWLPQIVKAHGLRQSGNRLCRGLPYVWPPAGDGGVGTAQRQERRAHLAFRAARRCLRRRALRVRRSCPAIWRSSSR